MECYGIGPEMLKGLSFCERDETIRVIVGSAGKTISELSLDDDELRIKFSDGSGIRVFDDGQCCCEERYMTTDDILSDYVGAKLSGMEIKDAPSTEEGLYCHDVQFLEVQTDRGSFTMSSHNEHNGFYAGFSLRATSTVTPQRK